MSSNPGIAPKLPWMKRSLRGRVGLTFFSALVALVLLAASASAATLAPTLLSPTTGSSSSTPVVVHYELPEAAAVGAATLSFKRGEALTTVMLASGEDTAGEHTVSLQAHNLTANKGEVKSAGPENELPDGTYEVTLAYQNVGLEPAAGATAKEVKLDTSTGTPTLSEPAAEESLEGAFSVSYELPEAALAGSLEPRVPRGRNGHQQSFWRTPKKAKGRSQSTRPTRRPKPASPPPRRRFPPVPTKSIFSTRMRWGTLSPRPRPSS